MGRREDRETIQSNLALATSEEEGGLDSYLMRELTVFVSRNHDENPTTEGLIYDGEGRILKFTGCYATKERGVYNGVMKGDLTRQFLFVPKTLILQEGTPPTAKGNLRGFFREFRRAQKERAEKYINPMSH